MNAVRKQQTPAFTFGNVTVPDGKRGPWEIDTFEVTASEARFGNLRAAINGQGYAYVMPGWYRRLSHKRRGVVMSNTPMEIRTAREVMIHATGRVLIIGLGLGMVLEGVLSKPDVTFVRVVEFDPDVIALVAPHYAGNQRVEIVQGDAYEYRPAKGERFDYIWHDIWDDISPDNLPLMTKLLRRYKPFGDAQGFWSRDEARHHQRRNRR